MITQRELDIIQLEADAFFQEIIEEFEATLAGNRKITEEVENAEGINTVEAEADYLYG